MGWTATWAAGAGRCWWRDVQRRSWPYLHGQLHDRHNGYTWVTEGDEAVIFSPEPGNDLETMARVLDTIPYEIMTSVAARVKRIYLKE